MKTSASFTGARRTVNFCILTPVFAEFKVSRTNLGLAERECHGQSVLSFLKGVERIDYFVLGAPRLISRKSDPTHRTGSYAGKLI
jgi:hypothetical protein